MKLNNFPVFEITLPISQEIVKFRPFVMKEEKILLMASESATTEDILNAINAVVYNCSFEKVNCETHAMVDVQYLYLNIRGKSVGEEMEFGLLCGECQTSKNTKVNINDVHVQENEKHTKIVKITDDVIVTMRYPKLKHLELLSKEDSEIDDIYSVIADCIEKIQTQDELYITDDMQKTEVDEFIDSLTGPQFAALKHFFDTMPVISHTIDFVCEKCSTENKIRLDDIVNFFV